VQPWKDTPCSVDCRWPICRLPMQAQFYFCFGGGAERRVSSTQRGEEAGDVVGVGLVDPLTASGTTPLTTMLGRIRWQSNEEEEKRWESRGLVGQ
jgi:hypothetical protein